MNIFENSVDKEIMDDILNMLIQSDNPRFRLDGELFLLSRKIGDNVGTVLSSSTFSKDFDFKSLSSIFLSHIATELEKFLGANSEKIRIDYHDDSSTTNLNENDSKNDEHESEDEELLLPIFKKVGANMTASDDARIAEDGEILIRVFDLVLLIENLTLQSLIENDKSKLKEWISSAEENLSALSAQFPE